MDEVTAWATIALVAATGGLVGVTWQLGRITRRNAVATEKAAQAALRQAEMSANAVEQTRRSAEAAAEQAQISRRMLEASIAPFLVPVSTEASPAGDHGAMPRAPTRTDRRDGAVVVTVVFRNHGRGPARIAGCNIVAAVHSYHGSGHLWWWAR